MLSFKKYINEIREEDLENIDLNRDLLFNNIFRNKLRILIPMDEAPELQRLINTLESLGYSVVRQDLIEKKIVFKTINTKEGTKNRPEKVGGVLQNAIKNNKKEGYIHLAERIKRDLDWWQKNSSGLKDNETGSSIIISRSPIDLVRMSDHDNISSCHSPGGSFFKCAKQEARTGGAVAFVVKNSDLKNVDIQKPELFKDKHRKIDGIVPLERLRLRRFSGVKNAKDLDVLVPELRTYGTKTVGFYDQVKQWAASSQKETLDKIDPELNYDDFNLKGGSYQDSSADKIWSSFFDKDVAGDKDSLDSDEEETGGEDLYDAAMHQINDHAQNWKHFSVHHDIYEQNILDYSAYCSLSIPKKLFTVEFSDHFNDKNAYQNYSKIKRIIEDSIDIYSISDIGLTGDNTSHIFNISIQDDDPYRGNNNQLANLEHFLDYIDDADKNFNNHVSKVYKSLIDAGYLKSVSDELTFKNFEIEEDDYEGFTIKSKPEKIGYLNGFPIIEESFGGDYTKKSLYDDRDKLHINKLRNKLVDSNDFKNLKIFPLNVNSKDKSTLFRFYLNKGMTRVEKTEEEVTVPTGSTPALQAVNSLSGADRHKIIKLTGWVYFEFEKTLGFDLVSNSDNIKILKHIDNNWNFYIQKLSKFFESFVKLETTGSGWSNNESPKFSFNKKKDYPKKPQLKKQEKQLTFKNFVS